MPDTGVHRQRTVAAAAFAGVIAFRQLQFRVAEVDGRLFEGGWRSLRIWDFEVLADADGVASRLAPVIEAVG